MYKIIATNKFKNDLKTILKRGYNLNLLDEVVTKLSKGESLPIKNKDHSLSGNYAGKRECHITPDWLLIYETEEDALYLYLMRTGTHSDLF